MKRGILRKLATALGLGLVSVLFGSLPALVIAQGPLGQLMTKGVLDRYLKDRTEPEERRTQAMQWLESLKGGGAA